MEDPDEICYHFAATDATRADLEEYLWRYPAHSLDLVDLWFELDRLRREPEPPALTAEQQAASDLAVDRAMARFWRRLAEIEAARAKLN
jgi:hypothetical protein